MRLSRCEPQVSCAVHTHKLEALAFPPKTGIVQRRQTIKLVLIISQCFLEHSIASNTLIGETVEKSALALRQCWQGVRLTTLEGVWD